MTTTSPARPLISVVIETVTARYDVAPGASMADDLSPTLLALQRQTYPAERIEVIVVLDPNVPDSDADEVRCRFGFTRLARSAVTNYYAAKNAGASAADGSIIALMDGDCIPDATWLERLVDRLDDPAVSAVAGRTRYASGSVLARTLSVPDFGNALGDASGTAAAMNINNVAFRREVLLEHPFEERLRRNGGCYLLFHQLKAAGRLVAYEDGATVRHGVGDIRGTEFVRKHFGRGFDGVSVYRLDDGNVLRGSAAFRRFGPATLPAFTGRRILQDWQRLTRNRTQIDISAAALPYHFVVAAGIRLIELAGMVAAVVSSPRNADDGVLHHG